MPASSVPADTELLFGETDEAHPFVDHEQMMPFVPFVRVADVDTAIALAKKYEHGFKHTAIIHSRNVDTITRMGREMDVTLFVQNGPSTAGLGSGGEGYLSFSIATPTGEGVTTPLTFTRQRRFDDRGGRDADDVICDRDVATGVRDGSLRNLRSIRSRSPRWGSIAMQLAKSSVRQYRTVKHPASTAGICSSCSR